MADSRDADELFWVEPRNRAIIPLDGFHVSRSLRRTLRSGRFTVTRDRDFAGVIAACAEREETWINAEIERAMLALHGSGHAHSIEVWRGRRAGRRALWREARPRLLRRKHVQPRDRRLEGRAGLAGGAPQGRQFHAARLPVHDRPPRLARRGQRAARDLCRVVVGGARRRRRAAVAAVAVARRGLAPRSARFLRARPVARSRPARPAPAGRPDMSSRSSWARRHRPGARRR